MMSTTTMCDVFEKAVLCIERRNLLEPCLQRHLNLDLEKFMLTSPTRRDLRMFMQRRLKTVSSRRLSGLSTKMLLGLVLMMNHPVCHLSLQLNRHIHHMMNHMMS